MALGARTASAVALVLVAVVACSGHPSTPAPSSSTSSPLTPPTSSTSSSPSVTPTAPPGPETVAKAEQAHLTLAAQVGQLFMVAVPATGSSVSALQPGSSRQIGNVMLAGRSTRSVSQIAALARSARTAATSRDGAVAPFVATDQEGGQVQVLRGPGFSAIPSALTQGGWSTGLLQERATTWGRQLRAAGINLDLAPVADTVPASTAATNGPIGVFDREFGHTPGAVTRPVQAFMAGLKAARVASAVKHFPGLGYVRGNTDTTTHVVDDQTSTTSASLGPFRDAVQAGAPLVMVSTATYARIDPDHPAAFSRAVITDLLRGRLGFIGPVISDDLGSARQVSAWSPGARAVDFVAAGGDIVLTVNAATVSPMYDAVLARARASAAFRSEVEAAALRVLVAKAQLGLIR